MSAGNSQRLIQGRRGLALMPTLVLSIGLLVLLAVGSILSVQWISGRSMVQEFAGRLIAHELATQELALRRHLDAAVHQADFVAAAIRASHYRPTSFFLYTLAPTRREKFDEPHVITYI